MSGKREFGACVDCGVPVARTPDAPARARCPACWRANLPGTLLARGYDGKPEPFRTLAVLATYANDDGESAVAATTIARYARCSVRKVKMDCYGAEAEGWIAAPKGHSRGAAPTVYRLNMDRMRANVAAKKNGKRDAEQADGIDDNRATKGARSDAEHNDDNRAISGGQPCNLETPTVQFGDPNRATKGAREVEKYLSREVERGAQNRNDYANPRSPREPKPAALSLQDAIEADPQLPNRCKTEAAAIRAEDGKSDLTPEQIATSWANFVDKKQARDVKAKDWSAEWRPWIRGENPDKLTQADKRANTAARMHANMDVLTGRTPAHASHRIFDSTATTIDPPAEPSGQVDRLDTAAIVVDLAAKFTGNAAPAAPATPPAPAGITPEDSMHNDPKRTTPPINLSAILNKRMPRVETEEQRAARMEAERQRQVAELRARGIDI